MDDVAVLDHPSTRAAVTAERAVLATLEGGCAAPVGVLAEVVEGDDGEELWVRAAALSPDGTLAVRMSATGDPADAAGVGNRLGEQMLDEGAGQLTESPTAQPRTPHEQPVTDCERQDA
jgi:hydroxymethylbilane synthase